MTDELKPCPFCGEPVVKKAKYTEDSEGYSNRHEWLECTGCARDFWPVEDWNTRPIEDAQAARIAELEAEADVADACAIAQDGRIAELEAEVKRLEKLIPF